MSRSTWIRTSEQLFVAHAADGRRTGRPVSPLAGILAPNASRQHEVADGATIVHSS
jgi:hypothetical protein